jgi:hypothetical protein
MREALMALRKSLILTKLRSSCLEGRMALIQPIVNFLTASKAGTHVWHGHGPPVLCQGQASPVWRKFWYQPWSALAEWIF